VTLVMDNLSMRKPSVLSEVFAPEQAWRIMGRLEFVQLPILISAQRPFKFTRWYDVSALPLTLPHHRTPGTKCGPVSR